MILVRQKTVRSVKQENERNLLYKKQEIQGKVLCNMVSVRALRQPDISLMSATAGVSSASKSRWDHRVTFSVVHDGSMTSGP